VCVSQFSHSSPHPHWPYGVSVGMKFFHTQSQTHTGSMVRVCVCLFSHSISNPHWLYGSSVCISVFALKPTPTLALWCECGDEVFSHSISHPHWLIRVSLGVSVGMKFFHTQSQTHTGSMVRVCVCLFSHSISNPHWLYGLSVCMSVFTLNIKPTLALWFECVYLSFRTQAHTHTGPMV
jgi:hypothetical protein